jgi:hypothetical protein
MVRYRCDQHKLRAVGELVVARIGHVLLLRTVDVGGGTVWNGE